MALAVAMAQEQAFSAATTTLPKNEDELKTTITGWILSHGQAGGVALLVVLVAVVLLSQAQNIEAAKRLLGLERKPAEAPPKPVKAKGTSVEVSGTENITLTEVRAERDVVVNQTIHHHTQATPDPKVPLGGLTNLPAARPGFLARASELQTLATDLAPAGAQVVIHGLPGVGKTSLALHYAHTHGGAYPGGVWWLDARKEFDALALDAVTELETRIGLSREEGLNLEARLRRCFQSWPGQPEQPVLLVVDNLPPAPDGLKLMERLTTGLPGRFRRLLTQRGLPPSGTPAVKLPVLAPDEALELLKARSGASGTERIAREEEQARELLEEVGRLPLALVLLGGRLDRLLSLKVSDLRQELAHSALQAKAFTQQNADFQGEQGLVATLLTSWATLSPETMELARLLSLTLPAPIPWQLIEPCAPAGPPTTPQPHTRHWDDALSELVGANLLDALTGDSPRYALHPLVRHFFSLQRQGWEPEPHWRQVLLTAAQALALAGRGEGLPGSGDC
ncbi:MAG: NB-ARC domain-containing protein, partial [Cyanobium sp.]